MNDPVVRDFEEVDEKLPFLARILVNRGIDFRQLEKDDSDNPEWVAAVASIVAIVRENLECFSTMTADEMDATLNLLNTACEVTVCAHKGELERIIMLPSTPKQIVLAAISENGCIGLNGAIPWHCPEDLKRFKKQTMGSTILMGRKTYETLGKPLPGRENIVVTRNFDSVLLRDTYPNLHFCRGLEAALHHCRDLPEVFIVGGSEIYRQLLPSAYELRLTKIPGDYDGDVFFPEWPLSNEWIEIDKEPGEGDSNVEYITYRRMNDS